MEKKQEEHDKKQDELECQLARLKNRLESRFKLPNVDTSTLDTKYMSFHEMEREASRLWVLIGERDIPDKESILKRLNDAKDELRSLEEAEREAICEMGIMSKKIVDTGASWNGKRNTVEASSIPLSSSPE